jgi:hypothetical protein
MRFDSRSKNELWKEAEEKELQSLEEYNVFQDIGTGTAPPIGYKSIRCHMIYDMKHDGQHRGWLVAGGHLTPVPDTSVCSGVISLRAL